MPAPRNDAKANAMFDLYEKGFSLAEVGKAFGTSRQGVYKMFEKRGFQLRGTQPLPFIMWNGVKYALRSHGYYASTVGARTYIHRDIWESVIGPIPEGFDVHHKDEDKSNNSIENLDLLSKVEHGKTHAPTNTGMIATQFKPGRQGTYYPRK